MIGDWARRKGARKINWESTIINWLKKDYKAGNLYTIHDRIRLQPRQQYGSEFEKRADLAQRVLASIQYDAEGNRI